MHALPDMPVVLTIAGFDPSGCAGILADVKTFEANGAYGMAVCTANTEQNIKEFNKANWINSEEIIEQLNLLQKEVDFEYVKIGLVENLDLFHVLIDELVRRKPSVKIIWDPVCKASAGFTFHSEIQKGVLEEICTKLYLITPNLDELALLAPGMEPEQAGKYLGSFCNVLVKGGHSVTAHSNDVLYTKTNEHHLKAEKLESFSKRGTGCVLSSAILANLAKGKDLVQSCSDAKKYIHRYLTSDRSLVGIHMVRISRMHYITDSPVCIDQACKGGADWVQLRVKNKTEAEWKQIAAEAKSICHKYGTKLIINDNVKLAREIGADGVHLGKNDMPPDEARSILGQEAIIGGTANTFEDIMHLVRLGVDYIGAGPFRFTRTKYNLSPLLGLLGYMELMKKCADENIRTPVVAIGGILLSDIDALCATGVHGIAVSSAITDSGDVGKAAGLFMNKFKK